MPPRPFSPQDRFRTGKAFFVQETIVEMDSDSDATPKGSPKPQPMQELSRSSSGNRNWKNLGVINPADFGSYVKDTEDAHDDKLPTHFTPMLYDLQPYARCNAEIIPILNRFPCRSGSDLAISSTSDSSNSTDVSSLCVCNHKGNTIDIPSYAEYTTASPHIPLHKGHDTTRASSNANSDPPCRCQSRTPTKGLIGHTPFKSAAPGVGHGEEFRVLEQELMSLQLDSGELDLKAFNALGF